MARQKEGTPRATYSVRLNPDLLRVVKHIAIDENKSVGELLEEGIRAIIRKRKITAGHALHDNRAASKDDNADIHGDSYQIPEFLRKRSSE